MPPMIHQNRRGRQSFVMPRSTPGVKQMVALHHLEDFEKEMRSALQEFRTSLDRDTLELEPMENLKRKLVHNIASEFELRTQSHGVEPNRKITVMKSKFARNVILTDAQPLRLGDNQLASILDFLHDHPVNLADLDDHLKADISCDRESKPSFSSAIPPMPIVPPEPKTSDEMMRFRSRLPASNCRDKVLRSIEQHKVTIITGGTGCGKTTQVPQFLLEEATRCREPIRIICTQPRRLPAIAVAERVTRERNETVGDTVGYHIRLEQKTSERTILTYCTSGILLRMLSVDSFAQGITHIILDEVHERETNTDYLLIVLREALAKRDGLKLILMSATIEGNKDLFLGYFKKYQCGTCDIPSRLFTVEKFYLPDVLAMTGYMPTSSFGGQWGSQSNSFLNNNGFAGNPSHENLPTVRTVPDLQYYDQQQSSSNWQQPMTHQYPPPQANYAANQYHHQEDLHRSNTYPSNLQMAPGSYCSSTTYFYDQTGTMAIPVTTTYYDPYPSQQTYTYSTPGWGSQYYAPPPQNYPVNNDYSGGYNSKKVDTAAMLSRLLPNRPEFFDPKFTHTLRRARVDGRILIESYLERGGQQWTESIDPDLTLAIIKYCLDSVVEGSILVFLPGYDDINSLRDKVGDLRDTRYKPTIFTLHSQMNSQDQQLVFERTKPGCRKVILSTNIAEASLTIDDVVFVVDCGKVKEKSYDHNSRISQLKVSWIAQSNAEQRCGRAGRCQHGYCFRLYSEEDYKEMNVTQVAEMKRAAIHEICLYAKMFAPNQMPVQRFLELAPEPPDADAITRSLEFLEQIGALFTLEKSYIPASEFERLQQKHMTMRQESEPELTELGRLIAHLPLEPQLARLLLYGVALKVLSPVITLCAALAHRDPFTLPTGEDRTASLTARDRFSLLDYSDHLMLIRTVNEYQKQQHNRSFCRLNFLSAAAMKMIIGIRRQLFMELRRIRLVPADVCAIDDPDLNRFSTSWPMVQGAIVAGCYPGVGYVPANSKLRKIHSISSKDVASLHPSSSLRRQVQTMKRSEILQECNDDDPDVAFLVYQELAKIEEGLTLKTVTAVPRLTALLFAGPVRMPKVVVDDFELAEEDYDSEQIKRDDSVNLEVEEPNFDDTEDFVSIRHKRDYYVETDLKLAFRGKFSELQAALRLRFKFSSFFLNFLKSPLQPLSDADLQMLECVKKVLEADHRDARFNPVKDLYRPSVHPQRQVMQRNQNPNRYVPPSVNERRFEQRVESNDVRQRVESNDVRRRMESNDVRMQQVPRGSVDSGKLSDSPPADPAPTVKNEPPVFVQHPPKISRGRVQPQPSRSSQTVIEELNRAQNGNARPAQKEEPKRPDFKSTSGFNQRPEQPTPEKPRSYNEPKRYNQRSGDAQHKKFGRGGIYVPPPRRTNEEQREETSDRFSNVNQQGARPNNQGFNRRPNASQNRDQGSFRRVFRSKNLRRPPSR